MKDGFIKVAAGTVDVVVADVQYNTEQILARMREADAQGVNLLTLPELCLTGYTCGDLFFSDCLLGAVEPALAQIVEASKGLYPVTAVGLPLRFGGKLYNCAAVIHAGQLLGVVPKTHLPNYGEFYELRQFSSAKTLEGKAYTIPLCGQNVPFGTALLFCCSGMQDYTFGVELCEDLWVPCPPSTRLCAGGAAIILNLSASDEVIGKADYRRMLVGATSARLACGYIYCSASPTESTQDMVFSRHHLIAENGTVLAENEPFADASLTVSEIDMQRLMHERHRTTSYDSVPGLQVVPFDQPMRDTVLTRHIAPNPFVPPYDEQLRARAEAILRIQSQGLKKRLEHTHAKTVVLGISGGLDSTLALLVCVRAFDLAGRSRKEIQCVTMPCFGTTDRTKSNAIIVSEQLGATVRVIDIGESVMQHFKDIGHDPENRNVVYENSQARERTQILMDVANGFADGGIHVGTEDMSEFADGWCTYNGDHISMYDVNAGSTKTMVQMVVRYVAETTDDQVLAKALLDVLDTPVSPELLPPTRNGEIAQKSEDSVGPYNLQDFFLYYLVDHGFAPEKVLRLADIAYGDEFDHATLKKWLRSYCRRLFSQQFKRSCLQDGPTLNGFSFSPRTGFSMPSDGSDALYLATVDALK